MDKESIDGCLPKLRSKKHEEEIRPRPIDKRWEKDLTVDLESNPERRREIDAALVGFLATRLAYQGRWWDDVDEKKEKTAAKALLDLL